MFCTVPLTRNGPWACGSVSARRVASCGAIFSPQTCAKPRKKRCSGVKPSIVSRFLPWSDFSYARSERGAAQVRGRLSGDQLAVDVDGGTAVGGRRDVELAALVGDAVGARVEVLQVLGRPPVAQVAVRVELRALVVEAV